jgi:hypothetical protein
MLGNESAERFDRAPKGEGPERAVSGHVEEMQGVGAVPLGTASGAVVER